MTTDTTSKIGFPQTNRRLDKHSASTGTLANGGCAGAYPPYVTTSGDTACVC